MAEQSIPWIIVTFAGAFSVLGGVMNWDFFMNNYRAKLFVTLFGRQGARVAYVILGIGLLGVGAVRLLDS